MLTITTVNEVIDALGGNAALASLTGVGPSAVTNWRERGIAPDKFLIVRDALRALGKDVDPAVFAFKAGTAVRA
jgi:DNA-binding transcriptional regulator YdaS (Cro superfamily)